MNYLKSDKLGTNLISFKSLKENVLSKPVQFSEYTIIIIKEGSGIFHSDFGVFPFFGPLMLFATPLQMIYIKETSVTEYDVLQFHSDFYCIEYHREEVACNGLLFNNIYIEPSIELNNTDYIGIRALSKQIADELTLAAPSDVVLQSLLQLFLAKCSQIKIRQLQTTTFIIAKDEQMEHFKDLLEANFLVLRKPSDYAGLLNITPNNLTRKCSRYFKKTPSSLISERLITEAKKQLHLTRKSIKEIAYALNFQDEFYFSRFFKKHTRVSPQAFRDKTGISIVADLYMQ